MLFSGKASGQSILKEFSSGDGRFCSTTVYLLEDSLFGIESGCEGRSHFTYGKYGKEDETYVLYPYASGEFEFITDIDLKADGEVAADTLTIFFVSCDDSLFSSDVHFADSEETVRRWLRKDTVELAYQPPGCTWTDWSQCYKIDSRSTVRVCFTGLAKLTGEYVSSAIPENVHTMVVHVDLPYALLRYVCGLYESNYEERSPGKLTVGQQVFEIR